MTIAWFQPSSGISGDMTVAAFLDLGMPIDTLREALSTLPITGYEIGAEKVRRGAFTGTRFTVEVEEKQPHRTPADIRRILTAGSLPERARERALAAFDLIASAEGKAHDRPVDRVHFHEVGGIDSIVDVVGAALGLDHFDVERVYTSSVRVGTGEVECRHGRIAVPAPATLSLLQGIPIVLSEGEGETTTPTGASFLAAWAEPLEPEAEIVPRAVGYGAGSREDTVFPNLLRITLADAVERSRDATVVRIEANVDDQSAEALAHACERLLAEGALDAWLTPIVMKKGRPGTLIAALCEADDVSRLEAVLFAETTTFGVRRSRQARTVLDRSHVTVETEYGPVRVKVGRRGDEILTRSPEYGDCAKLAREHGVALRDVQAAALAECARKP